jgi:hypothetical protein
MSVTAYGREMIDKTMQVRLVSFFPPFLPVTDLIRLE